MSQKKGVERKRGNLLGFWFFRTALRTFGLAGAYGFLYFVGLYYFIVDRAVVSASRAYIRRRFPDHGMLRQMLDVYLLFVSQGKILLDRFAIEAGYGGIALEMRGYEKIRSYLDEQRSGFILLTAHVGNWQIAMTALKRFGKTVYLMMRPEDNEAVKKALNIGSEDDKIKIIFTTDALGGVIEAMKAIKQGDLVSIMGDRAYEFSAVETSFLGGNVQFPYGAFSIAAAVQCPVVVLLSSKVGTKRYVVDVSHIIPAPACQPGKRSDEMKAAVQAFARTLEDYVHDYPLQWFVFRDIWKSNI